MEPQQQLGTSGIPQRLWKKVKTISWNQLYWESYKSDGTETWNQLSILYDYQYNWF
jgi:hypothetical protein